MIESGLFKGIVHHDYNHPRFLQALAECRSLLSAPSARLLLDARNRVAVVSLPVNEEKRVEAVIKEFRSSGFKKIKTLLSRSKAAKAWRGADACAVRGVPTPGPIACLERRKRGYVVESYFVAEYLENVREIRFLFREFSAEALPSFLASLARFLKLCHERGILHRDLSDGNILVRAAGRQDYAFWLIDTNRIRVRRKIFLPFRVKNLVRLGIPEAFQDLFLRFYLGEQGSGGFLRLWYRWNKKVYTGFVALKKKLHLKKIAEKLRIQ